MSETSAMKLGSSSHPVRRPTATLAAKLSVCALALPAAFWISLGILASNWTWSASARVCSEAHAEVTATVGQVVLEPTRCFVLLAPNSLVRYIPDPVCPLDSDSIMHGEILVRLVNGVCPYRAGDLFQRRVTLNSQGFLIAN